MIGSELTGILVIRLNVISSSRLVDESVSRLDTIIRRSGLASTSISRLYVIVNAARGKILFQGKIIEEGEYTREIKTPVEAYPKKEK